MKKLSCLGMISVSAFEKLLALMFEVKGFNSKDVFSDISDELTSLL